MEGVISLHSTWLDPHLINRVSLMQKPEAMPVLHGSNDWAEGATLRKAGGNCPLSLPQEGAQAESESA